MDSEVHFEDIPDVAVQHLLSYLPVSDLRNIRLTSTRMSREVTRLDTRFKTWMIDVSKEPTDNNIIERSHTEFNLYCDDNTDAGLEILQEWVHKYRDRISGLVFKDLELLQSLDETLNLPVLKRVELFSTSTELLTSLLSNFGHQIEFLKIDNVNLATVQLESFQLPNLKQLHLNFVKGISQILKCVPSRMSSLDGVCLYIKQDDERVQFPVDSQTNLKFKKIRLHGFVETEGILTCLENSAESLTYLNLENGYVRKLRSMKKSFHRLGTIDIRKCLIHSTVFREMLINSSHTLRTLNLSTSDFQSVEDLDFDLPELQNLLVVNVMNVEWLPCLLRKCSRSLSTLVLKQVDISCLETLDHDLKSLRKLSIQNCQNVELGISPLLKKCSHCLEVLHICDSKEINLHHQIPTLKGLYLDSVSVDGLCELLDSCKLIVEAVGLYNNPGLMNDVIGCDLPNLKILNVCPRPSIDIASALSDTMQGSVDIRHDNDSRAWRKLYLYFDHGNQDCTKLMDENTANLQMPNFPDIDLDDQNFLSLNSYSLMAVLGVVISVFYYVIVTLNS